jgi:hypothetical protein
MKTFRVTLHRDNLVEIDARNEKEAMELAEFFLSDPRDASSNREREEHSFRIHSVEMASNEAIEAEEISDDN